MNKIRLFLISIATLAVIAGCDEMKRTGIQSNKLVLDLGVDLSGSVPDEKLADLRERTAWIVSQYGSEPRIRTNISWFARDFGRIYSGESQPADVRGSLESALNRDEEGSKVPKKAFVGTNLTKLFGSISREMDLEAAAHQSATHLVFLATDGGLTEDVRSLRAAAQDLARRNVVVVVAGVTSAPGVNNAELTEYKLGPLAKAGKLCVIHEAAYDSELENLWNSRLKALPR